MEFTVGTRDLRQALRSVAPHHDHDKDFPPLHRVRLDVGPQNVTVSATNRYTLGHALVSVWDNADGEIGPIDLSPLDVKEILMLFKAGKGGEDDMPDDTLTIKTTASDLIVTDVSGLFPGKQLKVPRYALEDNYPSIVDLLNEQLATGGISTSRLSTNADMLGLFNHAAKAYGERLVLDPRGDAGAILITCGESFVGMLMPVRLDEDDQVKITRWHDGWIKRLQEHIDTGHTRRRRTKASK